MEIFNSLPGQAQRVDYIVYFAYAKTNQGLRYIL